MTRKASFSLLTLLALIGLVAGWFLAGLLHPVAASPVSLGDSGQDQMERPLSRHGYCCMVKGSACTEVLNPVGCFREKGIAFNDKQDRCDHFCTAIGNP